MSGARAVVKNTAALVLSKVLGLSNTILVAWLIARTLQVTGLGAYSTVMAFFMTLSLWTDLGISQFIPRDVSRDLSLTNRYVVHLAVFSTAISVAITVLLMVLAPVLGGSPDTTAGLMVVSFALLPTALLGILHATLVTHQRVELITYSQIAENVGGILGTVYLLANGYGVVAVLINFTAFRYLTLFLRGYLLFRHVSAFRWEFDSEFLKTILSGLQAFTLIGILSGITSQAEILTLSILGDDAAVGHYSAPLKLITVWYLIPESLLAVVFPLMAKAFEDSPDRFQLLHRRAMKYLMAIALPLSAGLFAIGDRILVWFYGPGFDESIPVLRILSILPILIFVEGILWRMLLARNEQHFALKASAFCGVVRIATAIVLVSLYGYLGAGLALVAGYGFYVAVYSYYVQKGGTRLSLVADTWRLCSAAMLMGVVSWTLTHVFGASILLNVPFSVALYLTLVILFRGFDSQDLDTIRQVLTWRRAVAE